MPALTLLGRIHIVLATVGVAVFALATLVAGVYLVQERGLKKKKFDGVLFGNSAALETLEKRRHSQIDRKNVKEAVSLLKHFAGNDFNLALLYVGRAEDKAAHAGMLATVKTFWVISSASGRSPVRRRATLKTVLM